MSFLSQVLGTRGKVVQSAARAASAVLQAPETSRSAGLATQASDKETIYKEDIVKAVAEAHDLTQAESKRIVNTILDTVQDVRVCQVCCALRSCVLEKLLLLSK